MQRRGKKNQKDDSPVQRSDLHVDDPLYILPEKFHAFGFGGRPSISRAWATVATSRFSPSAMRFTRAATWALLFTFSPFRGIHVRFLIHKPWQILQ